MGSRSKLGVVGKPGHRQSTPSPEQQAKQLAQDSGAVVPVDEPTPAAHASPETWASYVNTARGQAAAAIVEWGRRISLAHDAYRAQPQRWGRTWEDWCQTNLGISKAHAHKLTSIGRHLHEGNSSHAVKRILPADIATLYGLARVRRDAPDVFDAAIANGTITPELTRHQALALLKATQPSSLARMLSPTSPPPFRRVAGLTLESNQVEKLEAIAASRGMTPAQVLSEVAGDWLKKQPMPDEVVTIDTTVSAD